jgi:uncharacterized protein YegJ (DUF2314 family)
VLLLSLVSCSRTEVPTENGDSNSSRKANATASPKNAMSDHIAFQFAIYYLPEPKRDPLAELDGLLKEIPDSIKRIKRATGKEKSPTFAARMESDPQQKYAPPSLQAVQLFGRGLNRDDAKRLQQTRSVLILDWSYSKVHVWTGLRAALKLTGTLARRTGGLIWDEATREVFSPDAWEKRRINGWTEQVPDLSKHTVIHAYNTGQSVRAITLGMKKFGLPDVVVEKFSWSLQRNMGHIVNLFAQAVAEGAEVSVPGNFDLNFRAIRNPKVRDPQITTLLPKATAVALLSLKKGTWEEGDPKNRLIEITFERGTGPDIHARQDQVLAQAFGWKDEITRVRHDDELKAASRRARSKLPALRRDFNAGLSPGEYILVKAPFATPKQRTEWMWVEVTSWKGLKITGLLKNEPFDIPSLQAGQLVHVSETDIFDYIRKRANGAVEGNETSNLIEKRKR